MPFKINYGSLATLSARKAVDQLHTHTTKRISELRIIDLLYYGDKAIYNGVYVFFDAKGDFLYVGKNSAQKFVERIPWHFSTDGNSWMNHLLKRTQSHFGCADLCAAARIAEQFSLLLIPCDGATERIPQLERFLRIFAEPRFNKLSNRVRSQYDSVDLERPLDDVLGAF